jgi:hydroxymethylpyrimidine/phosphomethylpyrimidine kinase
MATMRIALSIAGSDPTGGAGIQADLQVFRQLKTHGCGVISALTVQDTRGVKSVLPAFPSVVLDQLRVLLADLQPDAIKIGMLASDDVLRSVALGLEAIPSEVPIVLDPVLMASDGSVLLERRAWPALRDLLPKVQLVTPNLSEAEALTEVGTSTRTGAEAAARILVEEIGVPAALIKGGHRDGKPDDLLALREPSGTSLQWLESERIDAGPVHGTGCSLSSAIAAKLAHGETLPDAVHAARLFVSEALGRAEKRGSGSAFLVYS